MKYLIAIAFTFFSISIFAQGKFDVQGDLAPTGAYGIVKARNLKGGYLGSVHDTVARNLIPITYRDSNTLVFTRVDSTMWILKGGLTNDYWSVLSTGGSGLDTTKVPYTGANQPLISTFYIQGSSLRSDTMRAASSSGFRMYSSGGSEIGVFGAGSTNFGNYVGKQSYRTNINGSLSGNDFTTQGSVDSALAYKATVDALEDTAANLRSKISADSAFIAAINARQDDTLAAHNTRIIDNVNAINSNAANIALKVNIADTLPMLAGYKVASILTSGTLDDARLSSNVPKMVSNVLPAVDGSLLTNLNPASIATVIQTITATATINNSTTTLLVNPATVVSSLSITFCAAPYQTQIIRIVFGGTITSGNQVVTTLSILPNSGQSVVRVFPSVEAFAGDFLAFQYINTNWYQIN